LGIINRRVFFLFITIFYLLILHVQFSI
jgi:hypothetical protein